MGVSKYWCWCVWFLGEKLEDNEVAEVTKDCMDAEDDDGMIPYARKYLLLVFPVNYQIYVYFQKTMKSWFIVVETQY